MIQIPIVQRMMKLMLVLSCLGAKGVSAKPADPRVSTKDVSEEPCTPCEVLFSKLERTGRDGKLAQDVRVQERGEPKTGTGMAYFWASASLVHACDYLKDLFGKKSCRVAKNYRGEPGDELVDRQPNHSMLFEPDKGRGDARCSCETIDRVSIIVSMFDKHTLPVNTTCAYSHGRGIGMGLTEIYGKAREPPCTFSDGSRVNNGAELWQCMREADCAITDDWLQMAVFRDPRPATVSTFYHVKVHGVYGKKTDFGSVEAFVERELPNMCQWLAVRYTLFAGILADSSIEFWYEDAMVDGLRWHYHWLNSVGMQLPFHVVEATAKAAAADDISFYHKDVDTHPGAEENAQEGARRFEDEVSLEAAELADAVLRTWLPPVLLERFGVVA